MSKWGKLSWLFAGISLVIVVATRTILGGWLDVLWVPLIIFAVLFVVALIVDFKFYLEFLTTKTTKNGMNMGAMILMALVIMVSVNFLSVRKDKTFDLTEEKLFSLSDQSATVLNALKSDLKFKIFYKGKEELGYKNNLKEALNKYTAVSDKIRVQFINSYVNNVEAAQYLKPSDGFSVFVEYNGKRVKVEPNSSGGNPMMGPPKPVFTEESITQAIIKATRVGQKSIYFLTGHGEKSISSEDSDGIKMFAEALEGSSFAVKELNLVNGEAIPQDAAVIAIVGPQSPLFEGEKKEIKKFVRNGGSLFVAIDPGYDHNMALFTKTYGVEFKNNYIINDKMKVLGIGEATVLGAEYDGRSEITKKLPKMPSIFDIASEIVPAPDAPKSIQFVQLIKSHSSSYIVNELRDYKNVGTRKAHTLVVQASGTLPVYDDQGKVVDSNEKKNKFISVFVGDSDFLSTNGFNQKVNRDLAMNIMAALAQETDLISIRPKQAKGTDMKVSQTAMRAFVISSITLPLVMFVLSGVLWHRRRNS